MKRYLILVIIVVVTGGLIIGGYFLRKGGSSSAPANPGDNQTQNPLPIPNGQNGGANGGQGSLGVLTQKSNQEAPNQILNYYADSAGKVTFIQPDGQIFESEGKEPKTINSTAIDGLFEASFSADGKMIAVRFGDRENPQTSVFDIDKKTWQPLNLNVQALTWGPSGHQIAYLAKNSQGLTIGTLDFSQSKPKPKDFLTLRANDLNLMWIKPQEVLLSQKASAQIESSVWVFDFSQKTLTPVIENRKGFEAIWNASGTVAMELSGGQLDITNVQGILVRRFAFTTLPSKCIFYAEIKTATNTEMATGTKKNAKPQTIKEEFLNCAIPNDANQLTGFSLPDDYYKKALFTEDAIYQIKLDDGAITKIFEGPEIDAINLRRSGQKIYFVNRFDGKLYSFPIKTS